ncbi:MAG: methionyl-tRNA formyltransferase [Clostridia bacterium]
MKIVFMGTPSFAVAPLVNLSQHHEILAVVTPLDKIGNRNKITPCPVKQKANELDIPVLQYSSVSKFGIEEISSLNPDVIITCAFGQMLSKEFLSIAKYGVLNVHASLLPKYRGAAPINWALINGETHTGVTIMRTILALDAGDVILSSKIAISKDDNFGSLSAKLSVLSSRLIVNALDLIVQNDITSIPQNNSLATKCGKITKSLELIDWSKPSYQIVNLVRGLSPTPSAYTFLQGRRVKIIECEQIAQIGKDQAGKVIELRKDRIVVACGKGYVGLKVIQLEGNKAVTAKDFINGRKVSLGMVFGNE